METLHLLLLIVEAAGVYAAEALGSVRSPFAPGEA